MRLSPVIKLESAFFPFSPFPWIRAVKISANNRPKQTNRQRRRRHNRIVEDVCKQQRQRWRKSGLAQKLLPNLILVCFSSTFRPVSLGVLRSYLRSPLFANNDQDQDREPRGPSKGIVGRNIKLFIDMLISFIIDSRVVGLELATEGGGPFFRSGCQPFDSVLYNP